MILLFTECLANTGLGHLRRCTALAEILSEVSDDIFIVLDTDSTGLNERFPFSVVAFDWKRPGSLPAFLERKRAEAIFVDSYLAGREVYEDLQVYSKKLICIDDTNRIPYPIGSTILNPGYGGNRLQYDSSKNRIVTGADYVLLRRPFREALSFSPTKEGTESILVTVGGEDRWNLVPRIQEVLNTEYPSSKKEILLGPAFSNLDEIERKSDGNTRLHSNLSAEQIRDLMLSVDIAITAGGQTTYELLRCRVPMILVETAENQKENIEGLSNAISGLGRMEKDLNLLGHELNRMSEYSCRDGIRGIMSGIASSGEEKIRSLVLC